MARHVFRPNCKKSINLCSYSVVPSTGYQPYPRSDRARYRLCHAPATNNDREEQLALPGTRQPENLEVQTGRKRQGGCAPSLGWYERVSTKEPWGVRIEGDKGTNTNGAAWKGRDECEASG